MMRGSVRFKFTGGCIVLVWQESQVQNMPESSSHELGYIRRQVELEKFTCEVQSGHEFRLFTLLSGLCFSKMLFEHVFTMTGTLNPF